MSASMNDASISCTMLCAFAGCSKLEDIAIPVSVTEIGGEAFCNTLWLKEQPRNNGMVVINNMLYCSRKNELTTIEIPSNVIKICPYAFASETKLECVNIPTSVRSIGAYAFSGCTSLNSVNIPSSVELIEEYAFYNCSSLSNIDVPKSVKLIGDSAFAFCLSLENVTMDKSTNVAPTAFFSCPLPNKEPKPDETKKNKAEKFDKGEVITLKQFLVGVKNVLFSMFKRKKKEKKKPDSCFSLIISFVLKVIKIIFFLWLISLVFSFLCWLLAEIMTM